MSKELDDFEKTLADARLVNYKFRTETKDFYEYAEKLAQAITIIKEHFDFMGWVQKLISQGLCDIPDEEYKILKEILK